MHELMQNILYPCLYNTMGLGVGERLTVPEGAEEIPSSFLGQGRKCWGENPKRGCRNDTAYGEDDSF